MEFGLILNWCPEERMSSVLRKYKGTWTGKGYDGSLWSDRSTGHREVFRIRVNQNHQYMLIHVLQVLKGRVCCCQKHRQLYREWRGLGGRISARNKLFPFMSMGKTGRKCSCSWSCVKANVLFPQDLSNPTSHRLGCNCSVVLHVRPFSLGSWVQLWSLKLLYQKAEFL